MHFQSQTPGQAPKEVNQVTKATAQVSALVPATPEGYTPKEAALVLKTAGFPTDGKKIRRLLRSGKLDGVQFSGRWYIATKSVKELVNRLSAQPEPVVEAAA